MRRYVDSRLTSKRLARSTPPRPVTSNWPDLPASKARPAEEFWAVDGPDGETIFTTRDAATARRFCPKGGRVRFVRVTEEMRAEEARRRREERRLGLFTVVPE
jgi:hypothetical protein